MSHFQLNINRNERKRIIIIGAGIGGLCTGIRLQHAGFEVKIYEKNDFSGGCIRYVTSDDELFKIDESASLAINPLTYDKIFCDLAINPRKYFQYISLDNYYKVFTHSGKVFNLSTNLVKTQEELNFINNKEVEGYTKFIFDTSYKYLIAKDKILNRPFIDSSDVYSFDTIKTLARLKVLNSAGDYVKGYVESKELQELIFFQTFFMGVSPYKIPSIYTSVAANSQIEGISHIEGGLSAYVLALQKLFLELGGKICFNSFINKIVIKDKYAKGIMYDKEFIPADKIVLNTDYINGQRNLLNRNIEDIKLISNFEKNINNIDLSCSTFIIHLGLSIKFKELEIHNLYLNKDFKIEIEKVFEGKLPKNPSLYIYYPSAKDSSFCKNSNHSVMNIMVRVPNLKDLNISWEDDTKIQLYSLCIKILEKALKIKNLSSYILFQKITTPKNFQENFNYYMGSCFGIGHTFFQSMVFRPQIKDKKIENLYYVGASIHPGNGASIVMDCAKIVANTINNEKR